MVSLHPVFLFLFDGHRPMNPFLVLKRVVIVAAASVMFAAFPSSPYAERWILSIHGGSMDKKAGFEEMAFDQGFFIGGKALKSVKTINGLATGFETNYRLMDGEETVKDSHGEYDSSNSYKLADASVVMRYTLPEYRGTNLFAQLGSGFFWEKTSVRHYPRATTLPSGSWENTGFFYSLGGGAIFFDHVELYGLFNRLEDNEVITLSIGWIFN